MLCARPGSQPTQERTVLQLNQSGHHRSPLRLCPKLASYALLKKHEEPAYILVGSVGIVVVPHQPVVIVIAFGKIVIDNEPGLFRQGVSMLKPPADRL